MKRIYIVLVVIAFIFLGIYSVKIDKFNFGGNTRYSDEEMKKNGLPERVFKSNAL